MLTLIRAQDLSLVVLKAAPGHREKDAHGFNIQFLADADYFLQIRKQKWGQGQLTMDHSFCRRQCFGGTLPLLISPHCFLATS